MKAFEYVRASTLDEALGLLGDDGAGRPLAGGTDLLPLIKSDVAAPARLVDVKRLSDLDADISDGPAGLRLGALVSLAAIERHAGIQARYTALGQAAAEAASPQLRNMATIGGNLLQRPRCWYFRSHHVSCWLKGGDDCPARDGENQQHALFESPSPCVAVHPSDPAVALLALDASVELRGPRGARRLSVAEFFVEPSEHRRVETQATSDEIVVAVHVPAPADGLRSAYLKAMDRQVWAFALVSVAAALRVQEARIAEARLVLGGVANIPRRAREAEALLRGSAASPEVFAQAAEAALAEARPLAHNGYKVPLARALVRRALAAAAASPSPPGRGPG